MICSRTRNDHRKSLDTGPSSHHKCPADYFNSTDRWGGIICRDTSFAWVLAAKIHGYGTWRRVLVPGIQLHWCLVIPNVRMHPLSTPFLNLHAGCSIFYIYDTDVWAAHVSHTPLSMDQSMSGSIMLPPVPNSARPLSTSLTGLYLIGTVINSL
ncbi:hypothetical protein DL93DRAFT_501725 [Clavulina sp. PMI_390]|nr:hypothetical protein DL93DRAFT_501725 [Clavulina sp. PMI_390]